MENFVEFVEEMDGNQYPLRSYTLFVCLFESIYPQIFAVKGFTCDEINNRISLYSYFLLPLMIIHPFKLKYFLYTTRKTHCNKGF